MTDIKLIIASQRKYKRIHEAGFCDSKTRRQANRNLGALAKIQTGEYAKLAELTRETLEVALNEPANNAEIERLHLRTIDECHDLERLVRNGH